MGEGERFVMIGKSGKILVGEKPILKLSNGDVSLVGGF